MSERFQAILFTISTTEWRNYKQVIIPSSALKNHMDMKNLFFGILSVCFLCACGSTQKAVYQQQYQSTTKADPSGYEEVSKSPILELSMATGTDEIRAYGSAESGDEQLALNAARAQAIAALQEKIEVYVRAGLDRYVQETGVDSEHSLDQTTRNQVQTAVKGIVSGAKVLESRKLYNRNTGRYKYEVCVTYDRAGILNVMQKQSDRILRNEKQFEKDMTEAWDALDAQQISNGQK